MALFPVIKFDGPPAGSGDDSWLTWKFPGESVRIGTQLVVGPGQEAIFVKGGRVADRFGPGTHTLSSKNIPLLEKLINLPFGGDTPFTAEIYYVNTLAKLDMKWGTADPIRIKDPVYDIIVPLRAFGQFGVRVGNPPSFIMQLVGPARAEEFTTTDRVMQYFRGAVLSKIKDVIAEVVVNKRMGVLDVPSQLEEIGETCRARIGVEFERFGLEIVNFFVESISVPESDPSVAALREALSKKMAMLVDAEAKKGAQVLGAEGHKAEIEMLGDDRYRLKRGFDTMEKAVEAKSGPGGTMLDLGIGLGAAGAVGKVLGDIAAGVAPVPPTPSGAPTSIRCPSCGFESPTNAGFCGGCGKPLKAEAPSCPKCNAVSPPGSRFCTSCSAPLG